MEKRIFTTTRGRLMLAAVAVPLIALVALVMGTQGIATAQGNWIMAPTPGVDYRVGNYCVQDCTDMAGARCTANDVRIASITPGLAEVCINANDYASAQFKVELKTGATDRYDIGLFVATDGGSALSGNNCYHDFLQEASADPLAWNFTSGFGPFRATDADLCADTKQTDPNNYYIFQVPVTFLCEDADNNGIVDPIHTCTSWDQNAGANCNDVAGACPGTGSKCSCQDMLTTTVPILIYRGLDWGDLPDSYGTYLTSDGPRHSIQNFNNVLPPDTQAGIVAVWLGGTAPSVDYTEGDGLPDTNAALDDGNDTDDENGVTKSGFWTIGANGGQFSVVVNTSSGTCTNCKLGYWVDTNGDGDFGYFDSGGAFIPDTGESYLMDVSAGTNTAYFTMPPNPPDYLYARFRLYDSIHVTYAGTYLPTGLVLNGEVEDYRFYNPLAVELGSFTATPQAWTGTIRLDWETLTEVNNLGFNLYRAESLAGRQIKLNASLIPSQGPGGSIGYTYSFVDRRVRAGRTYYYWLEAVDLNGSTQLFGPRSAAIGPQLSAPRLSTP